MISLTFFLLHVKKRPYLGELQDELQFYASVSVMLNLFGGILLKADTQAIMMCFAPARDDTELWQDEDEYGAALMVVR